MKNAILASHSAYLRALHEWSGLEFETFTALSTAIGGLADNDATRANAVLGLRTWDDAYAEATNAVKRLTDHPG